jgi:hypothetical protein
LFSQDLAYLLCQQQTVRALVALVAVGKMLSDVSQCRGSEKGIHDGVQQNVCIGMSEKSEGVLDPHSAEDQRPVFYKAVHVVSVSYA